MSTIAVVGVLAGGGAYAASKIGAGDIAKNAVRSKQIQKNAVKTPEIADGAVTAPKLAAGVGGLQGPPGPPGADGADGTARAYAYVQSQNQVPCSPACTFDHAKGITGVTHPALGIYCVNAPNIDPALVSAVVTVENGGTAGTEGNTSAMIEASGSDCPSGQFEVITERQPITAVRNAADTGSVNVAGNAVAADDPSFMIVIP